MKKLILAVIAVLATFPAFAEDEKSYDYIDASTLRIINKGWDNTLRKYTRIPAYLEDSVRATLWERSQCSSGIGVRFATDSRSVGVKYELLWDTHLIHMADTGLKGTDLYVLGEDSVWNYINTVRPYVKKDAEGNKTKEVEGIYVENLDGAMREYMIYFPLYDGVNELWVKVDSGATVVPGSTEFIDPSRKIAFYGTSVVQGGCASRTGMVASSILGRELNAEVVNVGISGEGKMDACMARALADMKGIGLYLIDPVPNCTLDMCDTLTYDFMKIIADRHPSTPIVMVEGPIFPYTKLDTKSGDYLRSKNEAFRKNYEKLVADGYTNIYYVDCEGLDGAEDDGTVDSIHLTDLGFRHYADKLRPVIEAIGLNPAAE